MKSKLGQIALAIVLACALSAPAAAITWDFSTNSPPANLGPSSTFTVSMESITAYGFKNGLNSLSPSATDLYYKASGPGETGLGLADDPQHEIRPGEFISLLMPLPFSQTYTITLGSLQHPRGSKAENATIYECTGNGTGCISKVTVTGSGPSVEKSVTLTLDPTYKYFDIKDNDAAGTENVLLESVSAVPLPAAAWLLLSGLGGLVIFGRRKRPSIDAGVHRLG